MKIDHTFYLDKEGIDEFLFSDKARLLQNLTWYYGFDNNQNPESAWDTADLRVLSLYCAPGPVRAISNTYTQLDALVHQSENVFIDYCYFPVAEDINTLAKHRIPYAFGNVSHRTINEYDLVFVSQAILLEFMNLFPMLKKSGVPAYHRERLQTNHYPLIMMGGICVSDHDCLGGNGGVPDLVYIGFAEGGITSIIDDLKEIKGKGYDLRHSTIKRKIIKKLVTKYDNLYFPDGYDVIYDKKDLHVINEIRPKYPWVPDFVKPHHEYDLDQFPGFENKIMCPDASNAFSSDVLLSHGCAGAFPCTFCAEGSLGGGWRERSLGKMRSALDETIANCAAGRATFYSYNSNYSQNFTQLVYEAAKRFSKMSLINMRIDIISERPEFWEVAHSLGLAKAAAPVEGFGDRIRNELLNKNLSFEQVYKAFEAFYAYRMLETKVGFILTGHETEEDWDDAIREMNEILALRDKMGVSTSMRCNVTPLVIYPHTGLSHLEQVSAHDSLYRVRGMQRYVTEFKQRVRIKFNGQNYGCFCDQMVLDLGRLGTSIFESLTDKGVYSYASPGKKIAFPIVNALKDMGIHVNRLFEAKPEGWIFPVSFIQVANPKYEKLVRSRVNKKMTPSCTKTWVNTDPKCFECGFCPDQSHKDEILKREFAPIKTREDIQTAIFENKAQSAVRVMFRVKREAFAWSKKAFAYIVAARLIKASDCTKLYHSIGNISNNFLERANQRDWAYGYFSFDLRTKTPQAPKYDIEAANELLDAVKVVSISPTEPAATLSNFDRAVYRIVIKDHMVKVKDAFRNWKGVVKIPVRAAVTCLSVPFEERPLLKTEFEAYVAQTKEGTVLSLVAPFWVNPINFVQSLLGISYNKALTLSLVYFFGLFGREFVSPCPCGKGNPLNMLSGAPATRCTSCIAKALLKLKE